jgi:hypothetical protein
MALGCYSASYLLAVSFMYIGCLLFYIFHSPHPNAPPGKVLKIKNVLFFYFQSLDRWRISVEKTCWRIASVTRGIVHAV